MKKVLTNRQVKEVDAATIKRQGITSGELMENAAKAFTEIFCKRYKNRFNIIVFCGPGNNGGDGLAISRLLLKRKYEVSTCYIHAADYSHDFRLNLERLIEVGAKDLKIIDDIEKLPATGRNTIIVDALFGTGLNKPITGFTASLIHWMNNQSCTRVSVDVPSGLTDTTFFPEGATVSADLTITFQLPKPSLMLADNSAFVNEMAIANIGLDEEAIASQSSNTFFVERADIKRKLKPVKRFDAKWNNGHAMIISGSYDKTGAAILSSSACMRCGAGLLTIHIPRSAKNVLNAVLPEAMIQSDEEENIITSIDFDKRYNAFGIGPGIGTDERTVKAFADFLNSCKGPMIIDADGLNIISKRKELLNNLSSHIITPHIKEFDRLTIEHKTHLERIETQREFSKKYNCIVVLKSAYTTTSDIKGNIYFNSTGNAGLAKAGSGDVLVGIITAFLARGYHIFDAAISGVYVHGLAGDVAAKKLGQISMNAGDIIKYLPKALNIVAK